MDAQGPAPGAGRGIRQQCLPESRSRSIPVTALLDLARRRTTSGRALSAPRKVGIPQLGSDVPSYSTLKHRCADMLLT